MQTQVCNTETWIPTSTLASSCFLCSLQAATGRALSPSHCHCAQPLSSPFSAAPGEPTVKAASHQHLYLLQHAPKFLVLETRKGRMASTKEDVWVPGGAWPQPCRPSPLAVQPLGALGPRLAAQHPAVWMAAGVSCSPQS